jgi:enoyl-CoA hydratase
MTMIPAEHLHWRVSEGVAEIRIERPARRNATTDNMYKGLTDYILAADALEDVRCVVVRGSNGVFTAGSDINYFLDKTPLEREHHFGLVADLFTAPSKISKPVIAAVQGVAFGGGTGLSSACDIVLADEGSRFGIPEVEIGLWPCTLLPALIRAVGARKAYSLALFGHKIDAREAQQLGLVTKTVPAGEFETELSRMTRRIASLSPVVVQMGKRAFQQCLDMEFSKATYFMGRLMALNSASEDAKEGISAFLEKRKPAWVGR